RLRTAVGIRLPLVIAALLLRCHAGGGHQYVGEPGDHYGPLRLPHTIETGVFGSLIRRENSVWKVVEGTE
ncbi:hypothetical protein NKI39_33780, partial [Mesorhizobium sp. M0664]|uniref:hypothetical protein n=1 Tax=Mesorhizobium sp. M0664 TaxID=2956982 RepID=UPI00333C375A